MNNRETPIIMRILSQKCVKEHVQNGDYVGMTIENVGEDSQGKVWRYWQYHMVTDAGNLQEMEPYGFIRTTR